MITNGGATKKESHFHKVKIIGHNHGQLTFSPPDILCSLVLRYFLFGEKPKTSCKNSFSCLPREKREKKKG